MILGLGIMLIKPRQCSHFGEKWVFWARTPIFRLMSKFRPKLGHFDHFLLWKCFFCLQKRFFTIKKHITRILDAYCSVKTEKVRKKVNFCQKMQTLKKITPSSGENNSSTVISPPPFDCRIFLFKKIPCDSRMGGGDYCMRSKGGPDFGIFLLFWGVN